MTTTLTLIKTRFEESGGAEKYARTLADAFHEKGCAVTVLTTGPIIYSYPYPVISHELKSKTSVSKLWEFESFCDCYRSAHPSDISLSLERSRSQTHLRASSGVHKAYLRHRKRFDPLLKRTLHLFNPLHSSLLHIEKLGFEHPDLQILFANSHLVKREILEYYAVDPEKIHVIHNGVEWHGLQKPFDTTPFKRERFELLFIGTDAKRKGLFPLLKALEQLREEVHLSVVGVNRPKLGSCKVPVTFYGHQMDVIPFLQRADCLVIPSYYDPFANVTIEALAMGLFVVSSKTNGGSEILTPQTGAIIDSLDDRDAIVAALRKALRHPKTPERARLIRESVKSFDFSTQLDSYIRLCLSPISSSA